ncbi:MAG: hypothetical protein RLZZ410_1344 [Pseudomonadota bacterium]|jgi:hypothetical protein
MSYLIQRKFIQWIAILAVFTGSLAPSISQAISVVQDGKGFAVEVCTATGNKMTVTLSVDQSHDQDIKKANEHCPFCIVHGAYALPVNSTLSFAKPESYQLYPQLFYQSPKPLFAWVSLPSRAPPVLA